MNAFCKSFSIMENNNMTRLDQTSNSNWNIVFLCWLIASISTMGSFFFSAIMQFAPCVLCWYQRIFMFPLVIILLFWLFPFLTIQMLSLISFSTIVALLVILKRRLSK